MINKKIYVYDLETLNIFTATFVDLKSEETKIFVLTEQKNEIKQLLNFLNNEVEGLVGYNCIHFDAQILEYIYRNPNCTALNIRRYSQIITSENDRRPDVAEWKLKIPHLDLFRALSLSVKAKRTGLKWCEFSIDFENIEDLPSDGDNWEEQILSYNLNDVLATKALYFKYKHEIDLRQNLSKIEGINLLNSTEPDLSKKLFSKYLSEAMNINKNDLYSLQTIRDSVKISDIILPYINFKTEKLNLVLKEFNKLELSENDSFEFKPNIYNIEWSFGLGGLHASITNNIVESDDKYIIKSADVQSYYPNLAIRNKWSPEHIPKEIFCPLYESLFERRKSIPKSDPANYALKICLNAVYGMSNDKYSFLRDRKLTLSICINGQLSLAMLIEEIMENIPNSQLLVVNTDGFEVKILKEYEELYFDICKKWENITQLVLEYADYSKMIQENVNNYIAIYTNGKYKCKGRFEFDNIPLHKNKSHRIIPIAVFNYFYKNIPIEETIKNHKNIFDFCGGVKSKKSSHIEGQEIKRGGTHYELHYLENSQLKKQKLSKTVRYFISNKGKWLFKCYENGTIEHVEAPIKKGKIQKDWKVTYFNKAYFPNNFEEYNIDYTYYIIRAKEILANFQSKNQLNMF